MRLFRKFLLTGVPKLAATGNFPSASVQHNGVSSQFVSSACSVTISQGTAPYTYAWTNSTLATNSTSSTFTSGRNFTAFEVGSVTYAITCTVTDATGQTAFISGSCTYSST